MSYSHSYVHMQMLLKRQLPSVRDRTLCPVYFLCKRGCAHAHGTAAVHQGSCESCLGHIYISRQVRMLSYVRYPTDHA